MAKVISKIREIINRNVSGYYEKDWKTGEMLFCKHIREDLLNELETELIEYINKNYHKIYGSHDVDEFYKDDAEYDPNDPITIYPKEEGDNPWNPIKDRYESIKYNSFCARATLYPGKTDAEVKAILDKLYPDETTGTYVYGKNIVLDETRDQHADSE